MGRRLWAGRRRWLLAALIMLGLGVAGWRLPDLGLSYGLIRSLQTLGWSQVSVLDGSLSLFQGAVRIQQVQAGAALGKALGLDRLDLEFRWKPLLSRRLSLAHLDLEGLQVDVRQLPDGRLEINGLPLLLGPTGDGGTAGGWGYDVTSLTLTGGQLTWTRQDHSLNVQIDRLDIADLRSWQPDLPARLSLRGRVNGQPVALDMQAYPFAETPSFTLHGVAGAMDLAGLSMLLPLPTEGTGRLEVSLSGTTDRVQGEGHLHLDRLVLDRPDTRLQAGQVRLHVQDLDWHRETGRISAALDLGGQDLEALFQGVRLRQKALTVKATRLLWNPSRQTAEWDGTLDSRQTELAAGQALLHHETLLWQGTTRLDLSLRAESFSRGEGTLRVQGLRYAQDGLRAGAGLVQAVGRFEHGLPHGLLPPLRGEFSLNAEQVTLAQADLDWLRLASLKAPRVQLTRTHLAVPQAEARGVAALSRPGRDGFPWRMESRSLRLDRLMMDRDGGISLAALQGERALLRVTRTKRGVIGLAGLADLSGRAATHDIGHSPGDPTTAATAMPSLVAGQIRFSNSRLEFEDQSLSSPVRMRLEGLDLAVQSLDSQNGDQDSPFTARGRIGPASLTASGTVRPFQSRAGGELNATVQDLDLPVLSPYAQDMLGLFVNTGQLHARIHLAARGGMLDGRMEMNLDRLVMVQPGPENRLPKPPAMPIETVLDLLRQGDGRIQLTIPVSGDLGQPNFDFSDAVGQAIGSALKSTLFTTLKVAFPLLALIDLAIEENGKSHLALEPVTFPAGSADIETPQQAKLAHVADFLRQSPSLSLTLCGYATTHQDGPALVQQRGVLGRLQRLVGWKAEDEHGPLPPVADADSLTALAAARAEAGRAYLTETAKIPAARLFGCRPQIDYDAGHMPRLDMRL